MPKTHERIWPPAGHPAPELNLRELDYASEEGYAIHVSESAVISAVASRENAFFNELLRQGSFLRRGERFEMQNSSPPSTNEPMPATQRASELISGYVRNEAGKAEAHVALHFGLPSLSPHRIRRMWHGIWSPDQGTVSVTIGRPRC